MTLRRRQNDFSPDATRLAHQVTTFARGVYEDIGAITGFAWRLLRAKDAEAARGVLDVDESGSVEPGITALTGDVTASGTGSVAATVANVPHGAGLSGGTAKRVLFTGTGPTISSDAGLVYDPAIGALGIGLTPESPQKLHLLASFRVDRFDNAGLGAAMTFYSARGTAASPTATQANNELGKFYFRGRASASAWAEWSAAFYAEAEENYSASAHGSRLVLATTDNGAIVATEKLRVNNAGYLGVGLSGTASSDPEVPLHMASTAGFTLLDRYSADSVGWVIRTRKARGTKGSPSQALALDSVMNVQGGAYHSGGSFGASCAILGRLAENATSGGQGTYLQFYTTATGTTTLSEKVRISGIGNLLLGPSISEPASMVGGIVFMNGTAPSANISGASLYATAGELRVRDSAGNVTVLSPHNRSLLPPASHPLAWTYYSERDGRAINVDMYEAIRAVEELTGRRFIFEGTVQTDAERAEQVRRDGENRRNAERADKDAGTDHRGDGT